MNLPPKLKAALWFCALMLFMTVVYWVTFSVTGSVFAALNLTPSPFVQQWVTSFGGLLLTGVIISGLTRLFHSRVIAGEMRLFGPIIEALRKIAKGDFSVRVGELELNDSGMIGELANTVNQMALELDQMENMRQEFISDVSHEIQSPLTSIRGFAQALQNEQLTPVERQHYLTIIENESTRLSKLTANLLKLASLEMDRVKFEPAPYRLDRQIRTLILACEPQWAGKSIEIDALLEEVDITADEDLLSQVWINLLSNSIKFTPENGCISITLKQHDAIEFTITDNGIGILLEDQSRIFERFYKADKARTHANNGGSGLGLSIAQKIVEMHGGKITVTSQPGNGSTFSVTLSSPST